jgi:hypothetical protein
MAVPGTSASGALTKRSSRSGVQTPRSSAKRRIAAE